MRKTAFKTFVCSFVFSLFILFTINGLFFYTPKASRQNIEIPSKNISLFFTSNRNVASAKIRPVKKIALSLPLKKTIASMETAYAPAKLPTPSAAPIAKEVSSPSETQTFEEIPLEIATTEISEAPDKELVSADFNLIMKTPLSVYDSITPQKESNKNQTVAFVSNANNPAKEKPQKGIISITDPENEQDQGEWDSGNEDYSIDENELRKPIPLLIASADTRKPTMQAISSITESNDNGGYDSSSDSYDIEENNQDLLIPLQKDFAENSDKNFEVAKTADKNQIAMINNNVPLGGIINKETETSLNETHQTSEIDGRNSKEWKTMAQTGNDTPWIAAKGTNFPKNNAVLDAKYYQDAEQATLEAQQISPKNSENIKLAADMVQNILIPIPEDIMNEKNLVPQLESSQNTTDSKREQAANQIKKELSKDDSVIIPTENSKKEKKGGLLKSITSLFSGGNSTKATNDEIEEEDSNNSFVDRITGRLGRNKDSDKPTKILPAEMRLAFQPNRAEISGTTLKWLQAFANKVNSDRSVILEIRIDGTSSHALQQKRLNLLHNILTNKGVDYRKINTVFTTREPNSFIVRTVRINSNIDRDITESNDLAANYQPW